MAKVEAVPLYRFKILLPPTKICRFHIPTFKYVVPIVPFIVNKTSTKPLAAGSCYVEEEQNSQSALIAAFFYLPLLLF